MSSKVFRRFDPGQTFLLPVDPREWLDDDHLAYFVEETVGEMDLSAFLAPYEEELRGYPPYHPCMMVRVVLYGHAMGVRSSRKLEQACWEDVAFRMLSANQQPDHNTFAQFLKRHRDALRGLFVQVLVVGRRVGVGRVETLVVDGTKIRANAAYKETRKVKDLRREEDALGRAVDAWFEEVERTDEEEDRRFGNHNPYLRLPPELADKKVRREKIREALKEVRKEIEDSRTAPTKASGEPAPSRDEDSWLNLTDPDSRRMREMFHRHPHGIPVQAYNCQLGVDARSGLIVAADVVQEGNDSHQLVPMTLLATQNLGEAPDEVVADPGYYADAEIQRVPPETYAYVLPPRLRPSRTDASQRRQEMSDRVRHTKRGREVYDLRKETVEPTFGHIKHNRGFRQFLRRGIQNVRFEWSLVCTGTNLFKLWRLARPAG